jgi:hypothetical protein
MWPGWQAKTGKTANRDSAARGTHVFDSGFRAKLRYAKEPKKVALRYVTRINANEYTMTPTNGVYNRIQMTSIPMLVRPVIKSTAGIP